MSWWQSPAWPAPAKLNLMLRVLGRRDDGYHRLQTLFQFIDYGDSVDIEVRRADDDIVLDHGLPGVVPEADLTYRAARLLQLETGTRYGATIKVNKRLPMGGGLGGGSSDAATVLVGLNRLWGTRLPEDHLAILGARLGADVPVFVRGRAAWGEGIGEILTPVELPTSWYVVICPAVGVNTGEIFKDPELTRNSSPITIADFFAGRGGNDCLPVVLERYPEVASAMALLAPFGDPRLTGTGGCVFAEFACESDARLVLEKLPAESESFLAQGRNRSPLLDRAGD